MTYSTLDLSVENHIAHIQFNRPDALNTLSKQWWEDFPAVFDEIDRRTDVRVVVISSTGKHFCAGLDLSSFGSQNLPEMEDGRKRDRFRRHLRNLHTRIGKPERARVPVLVAVQGGCVGGGVDLVSACDMRYCTEDAFFTIHEINIGMAADVGTLQRLPRIIPDGMMREMAYTGRRVYGPEAKEIGLVNRVYPDQPALLDGVMEIAAEIARKSPLAIHGSKEMILFSRDHSVADGLNYIATWNAAMMLGDDLPDGLRAQAEKREAEFAPLEPRVGLEP